MSEASEQNGIAACVKALTAAGGELFEVGGPVRDRFLGRPVKDHDLLCRHLDPRAIARTLARMGKVVTVGKSFGVIKFTPHGASGTAIDIALPRRERSTGTGHRDFEVDFDPEMAVEQDLGRRDFTINAMALRLSDGALIDPFGGRADLELRVLRLVFPNAFVEDPLRLIRAVQFAARFGLAIEPQTLASMREHTALLKSVSAERIAEELRKLMTAPKPSVGFELMAETGLLPHVFPELVAVKAIQQDKQPGDDVFSHTMRALDAARSDPALANAGDLDLLFAVLLHDIGKARTARYHAPSKRIVFFGHQLVSVRLARKALERLKLSCIGVSPERVLPLIEHHMFETKASFTDRAIRRFIAKVGPELIGMLMDLRFADNRGGKHPHGVKGVQRLRARIQEELERKPPFGPKDLAVNGHDLMELGLPEGPAIGAALHQLVELVLDTPEANTREVLLAQASEMKENEALLKAAIEAHRKARRGEDDVSDLPEEAESPEGAEARGEGRRTAEARPR